MVPCFLCFPLLVSRPCHHSSLLPPYRHVGGFFPFRGVPETFLYLPGVPTSFVCTAGLCTLTAAAILRPTSPFVETCLPSPFPRCCRDWFDSRLTSGADPIPFTDDYVVWRLPVDLSGSCFASHHRSRPRTHKINKNLRRLFHAPCAACSRLQSNAPVSPPPSSLAYLEIVREACRTPRPFPGQYQ